MLAHLRMCSESDSARVVWFKDYSTIRITPVEANDLSYYMYKSHLLRVVSSYVLLMLNV